MANVPMLAVNLAGLPEPLRQVIANDLLRARPARSPDHRAEVTATTAIVRALKDSPRTVLEQLSHAVRQLTGADSAGVSLAGREGGRQILLWQAATGLFEKYLGSVVVREESPCGCVLDLDTTLLMVQPGRAYKTAAQVEPPIHEVLLVPFHADGRAVGTVWAISQSAKTFDAEDASLVERISELAALAYQTLVRLEDFELLSRTVQLVADERFPSGTAPACPLNPASSPDRID